jgi:hypothetical protein
MIVIGNTTATSSATTIFELFSTSKGFLTPRMTDTQRNNINTPPTGLIVYQTNGDEGLYIYKSNGWAQII